MYSKLYAKRDRNLLIGILIISVILRLGVAFYMGNQVVEMPGTADQISYHTLAQRVLGGFGFSFGEPWWPMTDAGAPTAHWSYLYTGYLVLIYAVFCGNALIARIIQVLIVGILQPYLAYLIGRRVFDTSVGLLAALITAFYTYFIYYAAALMTESFYITAILGCLYLAVILSDRLSLDDQSGLDSRTIWVSIGLGLMLGVVVLLRQVFMLFIPFLFLWIWWTSKKRFSKRVLLPMLASGLIPILMILPFTISNYARFDRFVMLNTNAGYAFYLANHPIYGSHFEPILPTEMGNYYDLVPVELHRIKDEALLEQELLKRGIQFVKDDPIRYIKLTISRIPPYIMFWPSADSGMLSNLSRLLGFGLMLPFMIWGVVRAFISQPPSTGIQIKFPAFVLLLFCFVYSIIHILTWTLVRYRLPVDAVLMVFAGLAIFDLLERIRTLFQRKVASDLVA